MAIDTEERPVHLESPRFENRNAFLVAGLVERYRMPGIEGIPAQWQRFAPHIGKVPGQVGWTSYGVCFNFHGAGNMDYMCGVEVSEVSNDAALPAGLTQLLVEAERYAVFTHRDHISKIGGTWDAILNPWLPTSGYTAAQAPQFETYGPDFDPRTGTVEIWIPIER
jgi:AraC family transcriptional regulator